MSNYVQTVFFTPKDSLPPTNPAKTIFGAQFDVELGNISTAISTKIDATSAVTAINGTANQVIVSSPTGSVTLSLPQSINAGAAPTFAGTNLSAIPNGALTNASLTVNGVAIALGASGTVTADASTLTGTTLNATVVNSSLTSVGAVTAGSFPAANLSGTTLNAAVVNSSLTSVGTLGSLTVTGNVTSNGQVVLQSGSFTATTAGVSSGGTATMQYTRVGKMVTLTCPAGMTGVSNAVGFSFSGLPAAIQPASSPLMLQLAFAATNLLCYFQISGGTVTVQGMMTASGSNPVLVSESLIQNFPSSGSKGLLAGWTVTYTVD